MDPEVEFVDTGTPSTKAIVAELCRLDRISVLHEVDEQSASMKLPDELKDTVNAGSPCRRVAPSPGGRTSRP